MFLLLIALAAFEFALDSRASVAYISLRALPPGVCLIPPDLFSVPVIFVTTDVLGQLPRRPLGQWPTNMRTPFRNLYLETKACLPCVFFFGRRRTF